MLATEKGGSLAKYISVMMEINAVCS